MVSSCRVAECSFAQHLLVPRAEGRTVLAAAAVECTDLALTGRSSFLGMGFLGNGEEGRGKKEGKE